MKSVGADLFQGHPPPEAVFRPFGSCPGKALQRLPSPLPTQNKKSQNNNYYRRSIFLRKNKKSWYRYSNGFRKYQVIASFLRGPWNLYVVYFEPKFRRVRYALDVVERLRRKAGLCLRGNSVHSNREGRSRALWIASIFCERSASVLQPPAALPPALRLIRRTVGFYRAEWDNKSSLQ